MANERLLQARIQRRWTIEYICREIGISEKTYRRLEAGSHKPHLSTLDLICTLFAMTPLDLGFISDTAQTVTLSFPTPNTTKPVAHTLTVPAQTAYNLSPTIDVFQTGVVALLLAKQENDWSLEELQHRMELEMSKFDEMAQHDGKDVISRRYALSLLAGLPIAFLGLTQTDHTSPIVAEEILPYCKNNIVHCWQLSKGKGNDLALAQSIVSSYIPTLTTLAKEPTHYQQEAAGLATQGYLLSGLISMHFNDIKSREAYCREAVKYASISEDINLQVAAQRWLACTYYYQDNPKQALEEYGKALREITNVTPLLKSGVYVELGVIQAQLGHKQEALRSIGLAQEHFSLGDRNDQNLLYTGHSQEVLTLWQGLTYYDLEEYDKAATTFDTIDGLQPKHPISERIRIQFLNNQALVALKQHDLEKACTYLQTAGTDALALGSKQRYSEACKAYQIMCFIYPKEKQVQDLKYLFRSC